MVLRAFCGDDPMGNCPGYSIDSTDPYRLWSRVCWCASHNAAVGHRFDLHGLLEQVGRTAFHAIVTYVG